MLVINLTRGKSCQVMTGGAPPITTVSETPTDPCLHLFRRFPSVGFFKLELTQPYTIHHAN